MEVMDAKVSWKWWLFVKTLLIVFGMIAAYRQTEIVSKPKCVCQSILHQIIDPQTTLIKNLFEVKIKDTVIKDTMI